MKTMNLLAALCLVCIGTAHTASTDSFRIESPADPQYTVASGGTIGIRIGTITFIGSAVRDMELKQAAFAILSTRPRPASALVNQKLDLFDGELSVKVGEIFFLNETADKGIGVFNPPQLLKKNGRRTFTLRGDSVQQNASNWEQRGIDLTLAYDATRTGLDGSYAVDVATGENIPGPEGGLYVLGESRIFRTVPEFRVVSSSTAAFVGLHVLTIGVKNPDVAHDIAVKKLTYRITTSGVKNARFVVYAGGNRANFEPVAATNGIVEVRFDAHSPAKIVPAGSELQYALVLGSLEADMNLPFNLQYLLAELLPDTGGVPIGGVMGTVAQVEAGPANRNNIIWSPFTKSAARPTAESEEEPDWTNSYGLPGLPFVRSWNIPQLAGITVTRNDEGLPKFIKIFVRGAGSFVPPYRIESSTDLVNWRKPENALGGAGGATSSGYWASTYDYQVTKGGLQFFRLINE